MFDVQWASNGFCNFPLITGFFLLIISVVQIYRYVSCGYYSGYLTSRK